MSGRSWTVVVGSLAVVVTCAACGGGSSSSRVTLPKPSTSRTGDTRSSSGTGGLVGRCHLMSARSFQSLVDESPAVPCSRPHNIETAGVRQIYSKLTKANLKETVRGYFGACGTAWNSYLHIEDGGFYRLWATPTATKLNGAWVIRCDVYTGTRVGYGSTPAVTRTSVRAQARAGHTGGWRVCTDEPPTQKSLLVDCSRPHAYEGVVANQSQTAVNRVYPHPAQLRARGDAVCRKAVAHRPDARALVVRGSWITQHQWIQQGRRIYIWGQCYFSRRDHGNLPPVR
jgi:Septum formation